MQTRRTGPKGCLTMRYLPVCVKSRAFLLTESVMYDRTRSSVIHEAKRPNTGKIVTRHAHPPILNPSCIFTAADRVYCIATQWTITCLRLTSHLLPLQENFRCLQSFRMERTREDPHLGPQTVHDLSPSSASQHEHSTLSTYSARTSTCQMGTWLTNYVQLKERSAHRSVHTSGFNMSPTRSGQEGNQTA